MTFRETLNAFLNERRENKRIAKEVVKSVTAVDDLTAQLWADQLRSLSTQPSSLTKLVRHIEEESASLETNLEERELSDVFHRRQRLVTANFNYLYGRHGSSPVEESVKTRALSDIRSGHYDHKPFNPY